MALAGELGFTMQLFDQSTGAQDEAATVASEPICEGVALAVRVTPRTIASSSTTSI